MKHVAAWPSSSQASSVGAYGPTHGVAFSGDVPVDLSILQQQFRPGRLNTPGSPFRGAVSSGRAKH